MKRREIDFLRGQKAGLLARVGVEQQKPKKKDEEQQRVSVYFPPMPSPGPTGLGPFPMQSGPGPLCTINMLFVKLNAILLAQSATSGNVKCVLL